LKNYKYKNVFDISTELSKFFLESLKSFNLNKILERTLVVNIPISRNRLNDRGFNQTYDIANSLAKKLNVQFSNTVLAKRNTYEHQSLKNKDDRRNLEEIFFVQEDIDIKEFKSITLVDDVITTGSTLEMAARALRKRYGNNLKIYAVCMLRGRAYYSNISTPSISTSTISTVSSFSSSS
jgi:ComF family protein